MNNRKTILFKLHGDIVVTENKDLYLNQIDEIKCIISNEFECKLDEIDVEFSDNKQELSEIDVTDKGMIYYKDTQTIILNKVVLTIEEGSDEYLDALNNNTLTDYLFFL